MGKTAIKFNKVKKDYNIYRTNLQRIGGIIFGRKAAEVKHGLKETSIEIEKGERVAVMGISESGVSTFLKLISGIVFPTKGKITVDGSINALIGHAAGFDDELSCYENIALKGIVVGCDRKTLAANSEYILDFADAGTFAELPLRRAPRGTNLKMALAIHLLENSDILVIDNVLNSGGTESRKKCQKKIRSYLEENKDITAVIATNLPGFAKNTCSRGIILHKGDVFFDGPIEEACLKYSETFGKMSEKQKVIPTEE